jgi:hypothetical protein
MFKVYEARKLLNDDQNPYRDFMSDEERHFLNKRLKRENTIQLLLLKETTMLHCVSMLSKQFQFLSISKNKLLLCDDCQQLYSTRHKCQGFYKSSKILYSSLREHYYTQPQLFKESRNTFPFFITFDCETQTTDKILHYFCHSVTLFCIDAVLAEKIFDRDEFSNIRYHWTIYFVNTF